MAALLVISLGACGGSSSGTPDAMAASQADGPIDVAVQPADAGVDKAAAPADGPPASCGCGQTPICGQTCSSPCGCCPCLPGVTDNVDGGVLICAGGGACYLFSGGDAGRD